MKLLVVRKMHKIFYSFAGKPDILTVSSSLLEGPAQAYIQALNLTEGMCTPAMAWLA
jgi:hypothetical protein